MIRVLSLQVGRAAPLAWRGGTVSSAIVKTPVSGPLALGREGFDGDEQADRAVHGGPDKAVCCYPDEHGAHWARGLGVAPPPGAFGENLRTSGATEADVRIGDTFALGTATVQVSQPRGPCFKLAARHGRKDLPALMARGRISGWYLRVLAPGVVAVGDELVPLARTSDLTVDEVMRVTYVDRGDRAALERALGVSELAASWRAALEHLLERRPVPADPFGVDA